MVLRLLCWMFGQHAVPCACWGRLGKAVQRVHTTGPGAEPTAWTWVWQDTLLGGGRRVGGCVWFHSPMNSTALKITTGLWLQAPAPYTPPNIGTNPFSISACYFFFLLQSLLGNTRNQTMLAHSGLGLLGRAMRGWFSTPSRGAIALPMVTPRVRGKSHFGFSQSQGQGQII